MRRFWYIPLLLLCVVQSAQAALSASVDNEQMAAGETVQLTLSHDGRTSSQPDLSPLKQDFDIVSRSTSSSLQITNGSTSSSTQLTLTLSPRRSGHLTIPSITWDSDRSEPINIDVAASNGSNPGSTNETSSRVFLETEFDPKSPYVQAGVHVTTKVYTAAALSQASLEFPDSDAALIRQAGPDATGVTQRNGRAYRVITRHYIVFPQHSGHLVLNGPSLSANMEVGMGANPSDPFSRFGGMFGLTKPLRLNSEPIQLDVQPRPSGAGASYWLPAQGVELSAKWNPERLQGRVGDPLTVTLHLQAQNLTAAQLPDLSSLLSLPAGLKAYPDQAKLKDVSNGNNVTGEREQSVALIADQAGNFTVPELRVSWWDTTTNQARESVIPAQTLVVEALPGTQLPSAAAPASIQQQPGSAPAPAAKRSGYSPAPSAPAFENQTPWKWISLGFGVLWTLTVVAWLVTSRRRASDTAVGSSAIPAPAPAKNATRSAARGAFLAACGQNDPQSARRQLIAWANAERAGSHPIPGLSALAKNIGDARTAQLLRELDRACYTEQSWQGAQLAQAFQKWPTPQGNSEQSGSSPLAPLYH